MPEKPLNLELDPEVVRALRPAARARDTTVLEVPRRLLIVVATDRLIDAVLDDGRR